MGSTNPDLSYGEEICLGIMEKALVPALSYGGRSKLVVWLRSRAGIRKVN